MLMATKRSSSCNGQDDCSPQHFQELIGATMLVTTKELTKVSSPAESPQYTMTIPAGTRCAWKGNGIVVADLSKVIGGNDHDLQHYHIWIYESEVEEVDDAMGC
jgi:hypothetical protein